MTSRPVGATGGMHAVGSAVGSATGGECHDERPVSDARRWRRAGDGHLGQPGPGRLLPGRPPDMVTAGRGAPSRCTLLPLTLLAVVLATACRGAVVLGQADDVRDMTPVAASRPRHHHHHDDWIPVPDDGGGEDDEPGAFRTRRALRRHEDASPPDDGDLGAASGAGAPGGAARQERQERSANLSHIAGAGRKIMMYVRNRHLQILPDGTVNGTDHEGSDYGGNPFVSKTKNWGATVDGGKCSDCQTPDCFGKRFDTVAPMGSSSDPNNQFNTGHESTLTAGKV
ncbi:hypothetical protein FOCC_FOCC001729 [Frankliniella occidentalis]|nr:hypothetical protein FOCC_FOCC001729 [Frankliniella occidentalis]